MDAEEVVRDEAENLEQLFGTDLKVPDIGKTKTIPRAVGDEEYNKILINDFLPGWTVHESRHAFHSQIADNVVTGNEDELQEFYENELRDIDAKNSFYYRSMEVISYLFDDKTSEQSYEEYLDADLDSEDLSSIILSKNIETDQQVEVFAHNSQRKPLSAYASSSAALGIGASVVSKNYFDAVNSITADFDSYNIIDVVNANPEISIGVGVAVSALTSVSYLLGRDAYDIASSEPLIEENLRSLDSQSDRRRAMLYNSRVEDNIEDFLNLLDDYGIE
jgi:hypothetical protein